MKTLKVKAKSLDVCDNIAQAIAAWGSKFHARYMKIRGEYFDNRTGDKLVDQPLALDTEVKPLKNVKLEEFN